MNASAAPAPALVERIDGLLPQTQCRRCGYPACRPYAEAVAGGEAIDRCPPGGDETVRALARLLGREPGAGVDPACGTPGPREVAVVDEAWCIGCTLCIEACPVDAILGGAKRMHAVLESECTGCGLCVAPCPVDCIEMAPARSGPADLAGWMRERAPLARRRHAARARRLAVGRRRAAEGPAARAGDAAARRASVAAAVARVRARRAGSGGASGR